MAAGPRAEGRRGGRGWYFYSREGVVFFVEFHLLEKGSDGSINSFDELINTSSRLGSFTCSLSLDYFIGDLRKGTESSQTDS